MVIWSENRDTSEVWVVDAARPDRRRRARSAGAGAGWSTTPSTSAADGSDELLLVTNDGATEFRLARCPVPRAGDQDPRRGRRCGPRTRPSGWSGSTPSPVTSCSTSRVGGRNQLRILPLDDLAGDGHRSSRPVSDIASLVAPAERNVEHDVDRIVVVRRVLPACRRCGRDARPRHRRAHRAAPPGGARPRPRGVRRRAARRSRRPTAPWSRPRSCGTATRRSTAPRPALLYGYGAYESVYPDQEWDPALPSLLDRGVVFVHAHVRGGGEGGRRWWLDGRLEHKQHTFDDHVAVADGLAATGSSTAPGSPRRGLSAGGLLQGAVFCQRPDRWRAVVAEVPFVDVVTTMLDPTHPAHRQRVGRVGRPAPARGLRVDARATRRTTTCRRPAAVPTCWSPAPSTTRG